MDTITKTATEKGLRQTQKAREVYAQARKEQQATARDNNTNNIPPSPTPFSIRSLRDIDKVTRDMMTSLANKDGRFTVAEVRVFSTLVSIFKDNRETMKSERAMNRLLKEHSQSQQV